MLVGWFLNMNIALRLGLGFGLLMALIAVFGLTAMHQLERLERKARDLYEHPFTVTRAVDRAEVAIHKIHVAMRDIAYLADTDQIAGRKIHVDEFELQALTNLKKAKQQFLGDPQLVEDVIQALLDWRPIREEVIRLRLAGDTKTAQSIVLDEGAREVAQLGKKLGRLTSFASRVASDSMDEASEIMRQSSHIVLTLFLAAIVLSVATAFLITSSIRRPLQLLDLAARNVSQGDLDHRVEIVSGDELGRLSETFNFMVASIQDQTKEIQHKNEENERLLLNILPAPIADRLKGGEEPIADHFPEVTVLFADIVGFTSLSEKVSPDDLVDILNQIFTEFDHAATKLNIEKIKTIGDCYMAVAGLTHAIENPALAMVEMGHEMLLCVEKLNSAMGISLQIRIGINCGPVVAGVIGKSKFIYDLWGDAVNLASRMESHGLAGRIHVTRAILEKVKEHYELEGRGHITIRGKGEIETFLISARKYG